MQPLAAWLIARPQNAVIGLAATLVLPVLHVFTGMILVLVVLARGERAAIVQAGIAGAIVTALVVVAGGPALQVPLEMLLYWVPALGLAATLKATRSLTLTMQVSALLVSAAAIWVFGIDGDVIGLTEPVTTMWLEALRGSNMSEQADALVADPENLARTAAFIVLWTVWMIQVVFVLFGYRWFRQVAGETAGFGRFSQLDFGRVIAIIMGTASVVAFLSGAQWLQNIAIVMLAVFWLQGLAIVHWLYELRLLPLLGLIVLYVMLPVLSIVLVVGLAVIGYSDAWFRYRRRVVAEK